jgi:hypothetical protein
MPNSFRSLSDILNKEKAFSSFRKLAKGNDVVEKFAEIFPDLTKTVSAQSVKNGILILKTDNSVMKNELFLKRSLIVKKVNDFFNEKIISDIKFY